MSDRRQPWMKWYPADWRADPCLRMCSLAARGLWMELLGFMHEAEPYGHLVIGGRAPTVPQIAALVGVDVKTVAAALAELEAAGVCSRDADDRLMSRRMVRDKAKAERDRENGRGGGNPKLRVEDKGGVNPHLAEGDKPPVQHPDKAQKPEARDTSSLRSDGPPAAPPAPDVRTALFTEGLARLMRITGKPDRSARSLLGRFLSDAADDAALVGRLLFEAEQHRKASPVAWIEGQIGLATGRAPGRGRAGPTDGIGDALRRMAGPPRFHGATVDGRAEEVVL